MTSEPQSSEWKAREKWFSGHHFAARPLFWDQAVTRYYCAAQPDMLRFDKVLALGVITDRIYVTQSKIYHSKQKEWSALGRKRSQIKRSISSHNNNFIQEI